MSSERPTCNALTLKVHFCSFAAIIPITELILNDGLYLSRCLTKTIWPPYLWKPKRRAALHTLFFSLRLQLIRAPAVKRLLGELILAKIGPRVPRVRANARTHTGGDGPENRVVRANQMIRNEVNRKTTASTSDGNVEGREQKGRPASRETKWNHHCRVQPSSA